MMATIFIFSAVILRLGGCVTMKKFHIDATKCCSRKLQFAQNMRRLKPATTIATQPLDRGIQKTLDARLLPAGMTDKDNC